MPSLVIPNTFVSGNSAVAAEVNANFDAIATLLNTTKLDAANLQDGAVTEAKIADNAVKHTKIGTVPTCRVKFSANISIPTATNSTVTWNQEDWDTDTMHGLTPDSVAQKIVIKTAGKYRVWAYASWATATNLCAVSIILNGAGAVVRASVPSINSDIQNFLSAYGEVELVVNDELTVVVFQDTGAARNLLTESRFGATWFGD